MQNKEPLHETDINKTEQKNNAYQIPVTIIQTYYISYDYSSLYPHVNRRNYHMRNFKLIRHNLIHMLTMRQADILMKHQAMNNGQYTIHSINSQ